jgi:hypothetical protein
VLTAHPTEAKRTIISYWSNAKIRCGHRTNSTPSAKK